AVHDQTAANPDVEMAITVALFAIQEIVAVEEATIIVNQQCTDFAGHRDFSSRSNVSGGQYRKRDPRIRIHLVTLPLRNNRAIAAVADREQTKARRHGSSRLGFKLRHASLKSLKLRLQRSELIGLRAGGHDGERRATQKRPLHHFHYCSPTSLEFKSVPPIPCNPVLEAMHE